MDLGGFLVWGERVFRFYPMGVGMAFVGGFSVAFW